MNVGFSYKNGIDPSPNPDLLKTSTHETVTRNYTAVRVDSLMMGVPKPCNIK